MNMPKNPFSNSLEAGLKNKALAERSRNARRVTHLGRVLFAGDCGFGIRGVGFLEDISTTGCRLISESPLKIGMELGLSVVGPSHERDIEIELAKVRWVDGDRIGLEFLGIDPLERERLRLFVKTVVFPQS